MRYLVFAVCVLAGGVRSRNAGFTNASPTTAAVGSAQTEAKRAAQQLPFQGSLQAVETDVVAPQPCWHEWDGNRNGNSSPVASPLRSATTVNLREQVRQAVGSAASVAANAGTIWTPRVHRTKRTPPRAGPISPVLRETAAITTAVRVDSQVPPAYCVLSTAFSIR